jgi:hypothetical protein
MGRIMNLLYTPSRVAWCMYVLVLAWRRFGVSQPNALPGRLTSRKSRTFLKLYWPNGSLYNYPSFIMYLCSNAEWLNHYCRNQ